MIRELVYALAATCKEAGELFDKCYEKAELSAKASVVAQTGYANGVQQHEYSIQSFASSAKKFEGELVSYLQELRGLSTRGRSMSSDFKLLAGGPSADWTVAFVWCLEHGIDMEVVLAMDKDKTYIQEDFGLTMASFVAMSNRLYSMVTSGH